MCIVGRYPGFRRAASHRPIRYSAMIAPFWLRDGTESALRTSHAAIDTAITGDPWAPGWMVYFAGGIASNQFGLSPASAEVRTIGDCYRLVGNECADDPEDSGATHSVPNSQRKSQSSPRIGGRNTASTRTSHSSRSIRCMGYDCRGPRVCPPGYNPPRRRS